MLLLHAWNPELAHMNTQCEPLGRGCILYYCLSRLDYAVPWPDYTKVGYQYTMYSQPEQRKQTTIICSFTAIDRDYLYALIPYLLLLSSFHMPSAH